MALGPCLFWICWLSETKNTLLMTAYVSHTETVRMGKSRPRKNQSERSDLPCHIISVFITWLAPRAGKMTQIARCDWLPGRARWSHLARSGLPAVSRKKNLPLYQTMISLISQAYSRLGSKNPCLIPDKLFSMQTLYHCSSPTHPK